MKIYFIFISILVFQSIGLAGPIIIGHRGASGHRPEHTLESYKLAIDMGADFIEPDLVFTKDGHLVARHENEISETTDAAQVFPQKKTTKKIDGSTVTGWFTEDLTLSELKKLKAKERLPFRSQEYNGLYSVPTIQEIFELVEEQRNLKGRKIGIYIETKHPTYFEKIGMPFEHALVKALESKGLNKKDSLIFIQSFELSVLSKIKKISPLPLVFLFDDQNLIPFDYQIAGINKTYGDLTKEKELKPLSLWLSGIGPHKSYILKSLNSKPSTLIQRAHALNLLVHVYTFRNDPQYLHSSYNGDAKKEYRQFYKLKVDGVFSDFPDTARLALNEFQEKPSVNK